jgi:hypothetical protein
VKLVCGFDCLVAAVVAVVPDVLAAVDLDASYFVVVELAGHQYLCTYPYCVDFDVRPARSSNWNLIRISPILGLQNRFKY